MNFRRRLFLSAPLLATAAMAPRRAAALETDSVIGTWDLLSLYDENAGEEVDIFGTNPKGRLTLDNGHFFSFILLTGSPMISPACNRVAVPLTRDKLGVGMIAYYGSYMLAKDRKIYFRIERGVTGAWNHSEREAEVERKGNKLILVSSFRSLTGSDYSHLTLERISE